MSCASNLLGPWWTAFVPFNRQQRIKNSLVPSVIFTAPLWEHLLGWLVGFPSVLLEFGCSELLVLAVGILGSLHSFLCIHARRWDPRLLLLGNVSCFWNLFFRRLRRCSFSCFLFVVDLVLALVRVAVEAIALVVFLLLVGPVVVVLGHQSTIAPFQRGRHT